MTSSLDVFDGLGISPDEPQMLILESPFDGQPIYDQNGIPAHVMVLSSDSKVGREHQNRVNQDVLNSRGKMKADRMEAANTTLLAKLTTGWHLVHLETHKAIDFPYTEKNARDLYNHGETAWVAEQVNRFAGERGNFPRKSGTESSTGPDTNSDSTSEAQTGGLTGTASQD